MFVFSVCVVFACVGFFVVCVCLCDVAVCVWGLCVCRVSLCGGVCGVYECVV